MQHYLDFLLLLPLFHLIKSGHEHLVSMRHERGDLEDSNKAVLKQLLLLRLFGTFEKNKSCLRSRPSCSKVGSRFLLDKPDLYQVGNAMGLFLILIRWITVSNV